MASSALVILYYVTVILSLYQAYSLSSEYHGDHARDNLPDFDVSVCALQSLSDVCVACSRESSLRHSTCCSSDLTRQLCTAYCKLFSANCHATNTKHYVSDVRGHVNHNSEQVELLDLQPRKRDQLLDFTPGKRPRTNFLGKRSPRPRPRHPFLG